MAETAKKRIDWDRIPIVIDENTESNTRNPYANMDPKHRDHALRELARKVLLRKAGGPPVSAPETGASNRADRPTLAQPTAGLTHHEEE